MRIKTKEKRHKTEGMCLSDFVWWLVRILPSASVFFAALPIVAMGHTFHTDSTSYQL